MAGQRTNYTNINLLIFILFEKLSNLFIMAKSFIKRANRFLITTILGGVTVLLPFTLFVLLLKMIFDFIRRIINPLASFLSFGKITNELLIDLIVIGLIIAFCFFIGIFVRTRFGRGIFTSIEETWLNKLPLYPTIKETVQQFSGAKKIPFSQVVMADVFGNKTRMIGFVSDEHENGDFTIFVPTGPNPTNGFIFHVSREQIEFLDIKPDEAMRTVIAVGVGARKLF